MLWAIGDCISYGLNGLYAPQDDDVAVCGKILLLDPTNPGYHRVVAKGVRNSQQMNIEGNNVVFTDIGGVTAEEVNIVSLTALLDSAVIENFGWGMVEDETKDGVAFGRKGELIILSYDVK